MRRRRRFIDGLDKLWGEANNSKKWTNGYFEMKVSGVNPLSGQVAPVVWNWLLQWLLWDEGIWCEPFVRSSHTSTLKLTSPVATLRWRYLEWTLCQVKSHQWFETDFSSGYSEMKVSGVNPLSGQVTPVLWNWLLQWLLWDEGIWSEPFVRSSHISTLKLTSPVATLRWRYLVWTLCQVKSHQWFETDFSSGYSARRLDWSGQCKSWLAHCQVSSAVSISVWQLKRLTGSLAYPGFESLLCWDFPGWVIPVI